MKELVIFDLDGTLLDTVGDLAACCNTVLERHNLPTHTFEDYTSFVGNGILRLVERAIPEELRSADFVASVRADFVELYTQNIAVHTKPYEGIHELLQELQQRGITLAVASNKFQAGCEKLVNHYFSDIRFKIVLGQRVGVPLKPDPTIVREIMEQTATAPDKILYVGDSGVDIQTAVAAGVDSVGVTWGFRTQKELEESGATHIATRAEEIAKFIQ